MGVIVELEKWFEPAGQRPCLRRKRFWLVLRRVRQVHATVFFEKFHFKVNLTTIFVWSDHRYVWNAEVGSVSEMYGRRASRTRPGDLSFGHWSCELRQERFQVSISATATVAGRHARQ